jgi:hypothetical protein
MAEILAADDPEAAVHQLEPITFYTLVREIGLSDAAPLVALSSTEQKQTAADLDCWLGDRVDLNRLALWLELFLAGSDEAITGLIKQFDNELIGLFLIENLRIFLVEDEDDAEALDWLPDPVESSPDGVFSLVMPDDPHIAQLIRHLLRRLYESDQDWTRQFLRDARHELRSNLEEEAFRVRSGRLEELGFLSTVESLEIYAPVNPSKERRRAQVEAGTAELLKLRWSGRVELPGEAANALLQKSENDGSALGRALRIACDRSGDLETADGFLLQVRSLAHRVVMADRLDPGDLDARVSAMTKVLSHLELGLTYLTADNAEMAADLIERWPLSRCFRVAANLIGALGKQARRLHDRGRLTLVKELPASLCSSRESALITGLTAPRPLRGDGAEFESVAQLESAAQTIALIAYKELWTFGFSSRTPEELSALLLGPPGAHVAVDQVTFDALLATRAANLMSASEEGIRLLAAEEVAALLDKHISKETLSEAFLEALDQASAPPEASRSESSRLATHWAASVAGAIVDEYGTLDPIALEEPHLLAPLLLLER